MKTKILSILALLLMTVTQGAWADELTVYDGAALCPYSPAYINTFDWYTRSQYIIPAANLEAMNGKIITALKYYSNKSNYTSTCNVDVYLKEVSYTTFNSTPTFETKSGIVYRGKLSIAGDGTLTITFTTPYTYNGGNLLIGMENTETGNKIYSSFYCQYVNGAVAFGSSGSSLAAVTATRGEFIPKTTFTYETPVPPTPVDLGLPSGKKWADRNVGALSATGYGTYYAWSSSDIATAQWGSNWRMPTLTEIEELKSYTDHEWATIGGVNGMKFMKKTDHSVYIFLPATGLNSSTEVGNIGYYWTSTEQSSPHAYFLYASSSALVTSYYRTKTDKLPIRPVQMFAGEGTEASPYLIASTTDWDNLSAAVNGGETYSGKYFKMTANVGTVSTTVGTSASAFNGTFDGNGHTLNVNISNSNADTRTAPFAWAGGSAVIKNLHVTGSLTNTARTSGIVGTCSATTQISSCRVSATISGGNHTSGISISGGQITNCLFDGKINGTASTAGFATYVADGTKITNCLFKPQDGSSIPSSQGCFYTSESGKTPTLTNCYYTSTAGGTAQGTDGSGMTAAQLVENLGPSNWKVVGGNAIPKVHPGLSGLGTQASPYLIASTTDWNNLVSAVNAGETYSGNYFKMTANISVSERTSTSQINPFSGTFDGDGYTLNLSINETGTDATTAAPFGYVVGGTIKNVNVTGSVQTVKTRPASLVGFAGTNCTILNCKSSAAVSSSLNNPDDGDVDGGAFVACVDGSGTLTITGCTFTGSITYSDEVGYEGGGFVGWMRSGSSATLTDCLFAPTAVSLAKASPDFKMFAYDNASTTLTLNNCYYNGTAACNEKITKQDGTMQMHTIAAGDYVNSLSVTKGDATATYAVSGITVYSGGIDFNDGSTTTFYGGSGQTVSLALTPETRDGYHFKQYAASQGSLSDETTDTPTLTMPAANSTANDVVTISAQYDPTYNATFASGNDNDGWDISPTQQIEGGTVTVSYTGENKVKSVTVTKLALCSLSEVTSEHMGKIIGADGNVYASLAQAEKVTSAVGVLGKVTETGHGLIMSLEDAPKQVWATIDGWASASYAGTTLKVLPDDDARGSNLPSYTTLGSTTVSNWAVATRADYTAIFTNLGSTRTDSDGMSYDEHVNAYITDAGGTEISGENWSSTEYNDAKAWCFTYERKWGGRDKTTQPNFDAQQLIFPANQRLVFCCYVFCALQIFIFLNGIGL